MPSPDGLRIPVWAASVLLTAFLGVSVAGIRGILIANALADEVQAVKQETAGEKQKAQDLRERTVRIETKIDSIEDEQLRQRTILERIDEKLNARPR